MKQRLLIVDDERGIVDMMADFFSPHWIPLKPWSDIP